MKQRNLKSKFVLLLSFFIITISAIAEKQIPLEQDNKWKPGKKSLPTIKIEAYLTDDNQRINLSFYEGFGEVTVSVFNQETGAVFCSESFLAPAGHTEEIYFNQPLDAGIYQISIQHATGSFSGEFLID